MDGLSEIATKKSQATGRSDRQQEKETDKKW